MSMIFTKFSKISLCISFLASTVSCNDSEYGPGGAYEDRVMFFDSQCTSEIPEHDISQSLYSFAEEKGYTVSYGDAVHGGQGLVILLSKNEIEIGVFIQSDGRYLNIFASHRKSRAPDLEILQEVLEGLDEINCV